ncbi:MAG TPA: UPF0182 family protein [Jiangellaceae bacterium]
MSDFPRPADPFRGRTPTARRSRALVPTLVVLAVLAVLYGVSVNLLTERMWFGSVEFTEVWTTRLVTQAALFVVGAVLMAAAVMVNATIAYRLRPRYRPMSVEQQSLDRYRDAIDPVRRWVIIGAAVLIGLIAGGSASSNWETFLLWRNGKDFGIEEPQFNTDIGYFAFNWPWWRFLVSFGFAVVVIGLITAAITYYVYGAIRLQTAGERVTPSAQAHLSVLIGLFVLLKAAAYWLDRYGLLIADGQIGQNDFTGAGYTDINALLPAKIILVFIALICAVLFFVNVWMRNWLLPGISLGLLVLSAILLGGLWPFLVQSFQVRPSELSREEPYLQRNIDATRDAYDVSDAETQSYNATVSVEPGQLADDAASIPGIRLVDPNVVSATFTQQQQVRGFYTFPELLDVDRYELDDETRDIVIAAREIDIDRLPSGQQNWINRHTTFTHGFGVVAAYGNSRQPSGAPVWAEEDIPSRGDLSDELGDYEPRIYFGENSPDYSIVGAPEDANPVEFDIPIGSGEGDAQNEPFTYDGGGGVDIGSFFQRLLFATKFQETSILLTDRINSESVILYDRHPRTRLEKVAPWLTVDGDPYPAVVGERVVWIMDGYTTLNSYPYSQRVSIEQATSDSRIVLPGVVAQPQDFINYIRNSVKAVVDAYDGTVTLYEWDEDDPVLQTWMDAFPDTVQPRSDIPEDLMEHLRYPQDQFKIQRELLSQYHVTDASTFYEGQDRWVVPDDPANPNFAQPVYYQSIQMPGTDAPTFSLTTTYTPVARENLAGFMAVNADARSEEYGQIQVLRLPGDTQVDGPGQVANRFESDPAVATELSLLRQGGAETITGNLLTLPVGGGLMYVQPVYVQQSGATAATFPVLRRVLVSFGERVGFAPTLQEALDEVFLGEAGIETGEPENVVEDVPPVEEPVDEGETPPAEEETPPPAEEETPPPTTVDAQQLIEDAQQAFTDAEAAQRAGDWAAYGEALERLRTALDQLATLEGGE